MRYLLVFLVACALSAQGYVNRGAYSTNWLEHKAGHFSICFGLTWGGAKMGYPKTAFGVSLGLGIAKEWNDVRNGESQMNMRRDLAIDVAGAGLGYWIATKNEVKP